MLVSRVVRVWFVSVNGGRSIHFQERVAFSISRGKHDLQSLKLIARGPFRGATAINTAHLVHLARHLAGHRSSGHKGPRLATRWRTGVSALAKLLRFATYARSRKNPSLNAV